MTPLDPAALRAMAAQLEAQAANPLGRPMPALGGQANNFANLFAPSAAPAPTPSLTGLPGTSQQLETVIGHIVDQKMQAFQQQASQVVQGLQQQMTALQQQAVQAANSSDALKAGMLQVLQSALPADSMAWINDHIQKGSPGFMQFLQSETIKSVLQLGFEEYRQFLAGQKK